MIRRPVRPLALLLALTALPVCAQTTAPPALDTNLIGVYQQALRNNADLAAARAQYRALAEGVPQARAGLLPQLSAGAELADTRTELEQPALTLERAGQLYQLSLSQALLRVDRWFALRAAQAADRQGALQLAAVEQELLLQSAEAYFSVLRAEDLLAAAKAEEAALRRHYEEAKERFDVGLSNLTELLEAQASRDIAQAGVLQAEQARANAFEALQALTHRDYRFIEGIRHDLPVRLPEPIEAQAWVETALAGNLSLKASAEAIAGAEHSLRQRKAGHAPSVDLVARYQRGDNDALGFANSPLTGQLPQMPRYAGDVERQSIGVQLNIPLYSGGLTSAQVRESYHRLDQAEQQREALRRAVIQATRNHHLAVVTNVRRIEARKQAVLSSQSALEATEVGYEIGSRDILDVLDAQRQLYGAVRQYNDARYDYVLDQLRLKQAAGVLSPADLDELSAWLKPDYDPDRDFLPPEVNTQGELNLERLR